MPIFTPDDMQTFADIVTDLAMDKDCTITRTPKTDAPYGQQAGTPIVVIETVCLVKMLPTPYLIQDHGDRLGTLAKWDVSFPLNTNPQIGDVLTIEGQKMLVALVMTTQSYSVVDEVLAGEVMYA
jgi:hypothetical protein